MKRIAALGTGLAAVAGAGTAVALKVKSHKSKDINTYKTSFGKAQTLTIKGKKGRRVRVLKVGDAYQSATFMDEHRFEPVFEYYKAFDRMFDADIDIDRVLMIGGGGWAYPKHLLTSVNDVCIDVVEVDQTIIDIARKEFFLDELELIYGNEGQNRLNDLCADGVEYLAESPDASYDVIINDSFDGAAPTVQLLTTTSLLQAKRCLKPNGLYMLNAVIAQGEDHVLTTFMELLAQAFAHVCAIPCVDKMFAGEDNYLLIASDGDYSFEGTTQWMNGEDA